MGEIFYLAHALAIEGIKYKRAQFINAYATCILYANEFGELAKSREAEKWFTLLAQEQEHRIL